MNRIHRILHKFITRSAEMLETFDILVSAAGHSKDWHWEFVGQNMCFSTFLDRVVDGKQEYPRRQPAKNHLSMVLVSLSKFFSSFLMSLSDAFDNFFTFFSNAYEEYELNAHLVKQLAARLAAYSWSHSWNWLQGGE